MRVRRLEAMGFLIFLVPFLQYLIVCSLQMEGCIGLDTDEFIADLKGWVYVWDNYFGLEGHSKVVD